jgi:hypothetical protein
MASRRFHPTDRVADGAQLSGYRIVVVASSISPVVEAAGGFLCDRVRAGWDVSVLLAGPCDARPLAILGVSVLRAPDPDVGSLMRPLPHGTTVLVGADLLGNDPDARESLARAARQGCGPVIWGRPAHAEVGAGLAEVHHELSPAAMAFKAHALCAAGSSGVVEPVEALYRVRGESYRRFHSV